MLRDDRTDNLLKPSQLPKSDHLNQNKVSTSTLSSIAKLCSYDLAKTFFKSLLDSGSPVHTNNVPVNKGMGANQLSPRLRENKLETV